ncbi:ATP-binding protein [Candidatus Saccharibacteria bacterium]|nr:ATP-binding protein [Candidatus Saccharibacteria bacterium]
MITRDLQQEIESYLKKPKKIIVIFGARQVGKTTLLREIFGKQDGVAWYNGDEQNTLDLFSKTDLADLKPLVSGHKVVIIDEAQRIENIGLKLKILQDNLGEEIQFVATGSSSFDLANKINEPLTGRKWTFRLSAPNIRELIKSNGYATEVANLENRLIYGSYPAVVSTPEDAKKLLTELTSDNLYKDILNLGDIIKTDKLRKILKALALQVGSQVSMNEIGQLVGIDSKTADKYISLLEQSFIIFRLPSYARNLRNELKSSEKIFFYDNGIRNAIINDYRPLEDRQDTGALFENYIISEMVKLYSDDNIYFWRTKDQKEIDYIIERNGELTAIEIKYNEKKDVSLPNLFTDTYHPTHQFLINRENYARILGGEELSYLN